jgi:hypothetical protein
MTIHVWLLSFMLAAAPKAKPCGDPPPEWPGEKMPLPLAVQTPEDLAFKAMAEKQYLEFNLLASGKVAWDQGDFAAAAEKWEALLRVPNLPAELVTLATPLVKAARDSRGPGGGGPVARHRSGEGRAGHGRAVLHRRRRQAPAYLRPGQVGEAAPAAARVLTASFRRADVAPRGRTCGAGAGARGAPGRYALHQR